MRLESGLSVSCLVAWDADVASNPEESHIVVRMGGYGGLDLGFRV